MQSTPTQTFDPFIIDMVIMCTGIIFAVAVVLLQWRQFKKNHPVKQQDDTTRAPFGNTGAYNRRRNIFWREVRATFALALLSLLMICAIVLLKNEVTMASLAMILFWVGMFFYNLWVAQWYSWRIQNQRRR